MTRGALLDLKSWNQVAMLKTLILNKVSQRQGLFDWLLILFLPDRSSRQRHSEEFVIVL